MNLIKARRICANPWRHAADDAALGHGPVTVSLGRWTAGAAELRGRALVGVRLAPADDVGAIAGDLKALSLVVLDFSDFADGRAYTQARLLRQRYGYRGELRALGVRRDHAAFMARCGIDAFELAEDEDPAAVIAALDAISVQYQPAADSVRWIFRRREDRKPKSEPTAAGGGAVAR